MFVMTIDQQGSRRRGDQVPGLLENLSAHLGAMAPDAVVLPFERTVGDEVQGVLAGAEAAVDVALVVQRWGGWSVGIGAGPVDTPLAASARASSGPAFVAARDAVERARSRAVPVPVAAAGADPGAAAEAEAVLQLLAAVAGRRTEAGWAAIDAVDGRTQREAAKDLGISAQAVSQRLRTALWDEEAAVRPVVARLLEQAERGARPGERDDDSARASDEAAA
jgi:hypothetical protein